MYREKRGQATVFVIIGLVILLGIVLVYYFSIRTPNDDVDFTRDVSDLQLFVESCLEDTSDQALVLAGRYGGRVFPSTFKPKPNELDFGYETLELYDGGFSIPYWYYQDLAGVDQTNIPELTKTRDRDNSVQDQIERYIELNINNCLNSFNAFNAEISADEPDVDVKFGNKQVLFTLNMPVVVDQSSDNKKTFDTFVYKADVAFADIYNLANEIATAESSSSFLEKHYIEQISINGRLDSNEIPPLFGDFQVTTCSDITYWTGDNLRKEFKTFVGGVTPFLQITNGAHERIEVKSSQESDSEIREIRQGAFDKSLYEVSTNRYPRIKTSFVYQNNYPLMLDMGGEVITPQKTEVNLVFVQLCMYEYDFLYSFNFPVMINLVDEESDFNDGKYHFQFPVEIVVKNNFPRYDFEDILVGSTNQQSFAKADQLLCKTSSNNNELALEVRDEITGELLDDVTVEYQCAPSLLAEYNQETNTVGKVNRFSPVCFIGTTDQGLLTENIPPCLDRSLVTVSKDDYITKVAVLDIYPNDDVYSELVTLVPKTEIKFESVRYPVEQKPHPSQGTSSQDLIFDSDNNLIDCKVEQEFPMQEQHNILIEADNLLSPESSFFATINGTTGESTNVKIAPGIYEFSVLLMTDVPPSGNIPANSESFTVPDGLFSDRTIYYPDEDVVLGRVVTGGNKFTVEITQQDLNKGTMIIPVIDEERPRIIENIAQAIGHRDVCYSKNPNVLGPRFR